MDRRQIVGRSMLVMLVVVALLGPTTQASPTMQVPGRDSVVVSGVGDDTLRQPDYVVKPWRALRSHLHNKIIHVPIGFALSGFALSVLAFWKPELRSSIRWLVLVAAAGSVVAFLTGSTQATVYDGSFKEWVVDLHRELGIATAAALWLWCICLWVHSLTRWAFLAGVLAVALLTIAGFFGGIVAHG